MRFVAATESYALSPLQGGILFDSLRAPRTGTYFEQGIIVLRGELNVTCLKRAWTRISRRYEALRTVFLWQEETEARQVVIEDAQLPWRFSDWRQIPAEQHMTRLEEWLTEDRANEFSLSAGVLARLALIRSEERLHYCVFSFHHLLLDRWSFQIIVREVFAIYDCLERGVEPDLPPTRPYRDYIAWLQTQDLEQAKRFWRGLLHDFEEPSHLGRSRLSSSAEFGRYETALSEEETQALRDFARRSRVTLNTVTQLAYAIVLGRYTGRDDVVYGVVANGRPAKLRGSTSMVGLFINTLPVRVKLSQKAGLGTMFADLQDLQARMSDFEHVPLVDIRACSALPAGSALFDCLFVFQNELLHGATEAPSKSLEVSRVFGRDQPNAVFTLWVNPGSRLGLTAAYDRSQIDGDIAEQLLRCLRDLLGLFRSGTATLDEIDVVTTDRYRQIIQGWNETETPVTERRVCELIEDYAVCQPDAVAVVAHGQSLTYKELSTASDRIAAFLKQRGIGSESTVGLRLGRSPELIVALLGIMKSGAAYVPIDPAAPEERTSFILKDSGVRLLLMRGALESTSVPWEIADVDAVLATSSSIAPCEPAPAGVNDEAAYVMYTSGSTGRPKGVVVTHRGLTNYVQWCLGAYPVARGRGAVVSSSVFFDLSITSMLAPLAVGREVWLVPDTDGIEALASTLRSQGGFSLLKLTPAHLEGLAYQLEPERARGRAHAFVIGGEALRSETLQFWRENAPQTALFNEYGPTEAVVGCSVFQATDACVTGDVPIGKPIANTQLYVLDSHCRLAPPGVAGELYIGGAGLARCYVNSPDLTAQAFVPNPFDPNAGSRLYRTGDLARCRPDGNLEFLGRADDQLKVRGYRIELGEIEAAIRRFPDIREAAVIAREDSANCKQIVACVVFVKSDSENVRKLKSYLADRLPAYMIPDKFLVTDALSVTSNGKADRRALRALSDSELGQTTPYLEPRSPEEKTLAIIWRELLRTDQVGIYDNFYELGGHSLTILQLAARVKKAFQVSLPLQAFFDSPTVAQQAAVVAAKRASTRTT